MPAQWIPGNISVPPRRAVVRERPLAYAAKSTGPGVPRRGDAELLAHGALEVLRRLAQACRSMQIHEAEHFDFLFRRQAHLDYGYTSFEDFARQELQTSPRTARRHISLHRVLSTSVEIAEALREGKLDPSHALALKPLIDIENLKPWIELAGSSSVAELQAAVIAHLAAHQATIPSDLDAEESGQRVTFAANRSAVLVWDHGIELARRMLGWDAPTHVCLDAILSEASSHFKDGESSAPTPQIDDRPDPAFLRLQSKHSSSPRLCHTENQERRPSSAEMLRPPDDPEKLEGLRSSIDAAWRLMSEITGRWDLPTDPRQSVEWLRSWQCQERSLRLALVPVIRELDSRMVHYLGHDNISSLLAHELRLSGRTSQRLRAEAWLFEDNASLRQAFETGRVGLGQAYLIDRVASRTTIPEFISRASSVTHLYFEREIRFRERLQAYDSRLAQCFPGPLPLPGLEEALRERFSELHPSDANLQERLSQLVSNGHSNSEDPAQNSLMLQRLEGLLELIFLAEEEKNSSLPPGVAPTLAGHDPQMTISFWAPKSIIDIWERSLAFVRKRNGPLPTWAVATLLMEAVMREWCTADPRSRSNYPIHERDEWRCQAPGCSARRHLEIHHIIFKARGGSDDPNNLVTICHGHHRLIHDEIVTVTGNAPSDLLWKMGASGYWRGNKRLEAKS